MWLSQLTTERKWNLMKDSVENLTIVKELKNSFFLLFVDIFFFRFQILLHVIRHQRIISAIRSTITATQEQINPPNPFYWASPRQFRKHCKCNVSFLLFIFNKVSFILMFLIYFPDVFLLFSLNLFYHSNWTPLFVFLGKSKLVYE